MDSRPALQLVLEALSTAYGLDTGAIDPSTDLGDIGFDSLGLTAIVARAEAEYDVEFSSERILEMYQSLLVTDLARAIEIGIDEARTPA